MKLNEIMRGGPSDFHSSLKNAVKIDIAMMEWLDKYVEYSDSISQKTVPKDKVRVENGVIKFDKSVEPTQFQHAINSTNTRHVHMMINMQGDVLDPPTKIIHHSDIFLDDNVQIMDAVITDWSKLVLMPNYPNRITLLDTDGKTIIKSWNGLSSINLRRIDCEIDGNECIDIQCSIIPLVDLTKKTKFYYIPYSGATNPRALKIKEAIELLHEHTDPFELQDALISNNLEEFI